MIANRCTHSHTLMFEHLGGETCPEVGLLEYPRRKHSSNSNYKKFGKDAGCDSQLLRHTKSSCDSRAHGVNESSMVTRELMGRLMLQWLRPNNSTVLFHHHIHNRNCLDNRKGEHLSATRRRDRQLQEKQNNIPRHISTLKHA